LTKQNSRRRTPNIYISSTKLRRLGVKWVSLAPRYVGSFEKGIDYKGDLAVFEADIAVHGPQFPASTTLQAQPALRSDKFSIYPAPVRQQAEWFT